VLRHHFPEAEGFGDITKTDFTKYANKIDILTGGFPCQPYSMAGKRLGKEDDRHLWPEMLRVIREVQPTWVVGENVFGLVNWSGGLVFHEVQADLEAQGYEVQPYVLPAVSVNAPHRRDRVWFVAYSNSNGSNKRNCQHEKHTSEGRLNALSDIEQSNGNGNASDTNSSRWQQSDKEMERGSSEQSDCSCVQQDAFNSNYQRCKRSLSTGIIRQFSTKETSSKINLLPNGEWGGKLQFENFPTKSPICNGDDGLSNRLDSITFPKWRSESIKAGGNAIVPQVAYQIFKAIEEYNNLTK
jgi:DNA (cytosine-5)-methyltransferase 1